MKKGWWVSVLRVQRVEALSKRDFTSYFMRTFTSYHLVVSNSTAVHWL